MHLCLNHLPSSLVPYFTKVKNTMLKKMIASMIQKWYYTIIHSSYFLLREIDCSWTSRESHITPAVLWMNMHKNPESSESLLVISALVCRHSQVLPKVSPARRRIFNLVRITPMVLPYPSSEIPVTPKAGHNALPGFDTLLNLTHLSLHSTSSKTLLEASSD
jgi:hypothetical protein